MASNISTSSISVNFPIKGTNNNSQGFRTNFLAIKTALDTAKEEITNLSNDVSGIGPLVDEAKFYADAAYQSSLNAANNAPVQSVANLVGTISSVALSSALNLGNISSQNASNVLISGGNINGLFTFNVNKGSLPSTATSELTYSTLSSTNSNSTNLETYIKRETAGNGYTTAAIYLQRKTDASRQGAVMFGGPNNANGISFLNNNSEQLRVTADGVQLLNNKAYQWLDAAGSPVKLSMQSDNNFVFYGTTSTGSGRSIFSINMRNDSSDLLFATRIRTNGGILSNPAVDWTGATDSTSKSTIRLDPVYSGTPTGSVSYNWWRMTDSVAVPDGPAIVGNGFQIEHNLNSGYNGGRQALLVNLTKWAADSSTVSGG